MTQENKTPEVDTAAQEAAAKAAAADKAAAKAEKDAKKAQEAADKAAKKAAEKADKEAKKLADKVAKEKAKAEKAEAKKANQMPEQNGVRRPKDGTETGKVWKLADELSAQFGQPTPIANLLDVGQKQGLNDSTIRTQYARWRTFHGIAGRVALPTPAPVEQAAPAAE